MDCEKFDRVVLDLLYGELDELTAAAARRHMEHCARCGPIGSGLRATREVGVLPALEPPSDLEERILEAERQAHARLPLRERIGRAVSVMAGYAMRPQLAMAALALLVLASSLLLLRARPGDRNVMHVTERGVPEIEGEAVIVPVPENAPAGERAPGAPQPPGALREKPAKDTARAPPDDDELAKEMAAIQSADGGDSDDEKRDQQGRLADGEPADTDAYDRALAEYNRGRYAEAQRAFDEIAEAGGNNAASAALFSAQSVRNTSGCAAAAPRFEAVASRYPGISAANEAIWQAANCYEKLRDVDRARQSYLSLRSAHGYGERAQRALDSLESARQQQIASRKAARRGKRPAAAKPAAKPKAKAAPPAQAAEQAPVAK